MKNLTTFIIAVVCIIGLLICCYVPESSIEACMAKGHSRDTCFHTLAR